MTLNTMRPHSGGTVAGVPGGNSASAANGDQQVVRSGELHVVVRHPAETLEELERIATHLSGVVMSSQMHGSDENAAWAEITLLVPAEKFEEARAQARKLARKVEQDNVELHDITFQYATDDGTLRNYKAEEAQYLAILKRAGSVRDVVEVTSKLADVRGRIQELETSLRLQQRQVQMSQLKVTMITHEEEGFIAMTWQPLVQARISLHRALRALADYADSMVALALYIPGIALWGFTVVALMKVAWILLRHLIKLFFPGLSLPWRRPQAQST
ncbi:MAG TPA: DUF4349 domain-containing protein [Terriglobales bacterium]|nr:DUF4349 domain-containing protein [Terriglobales bacterium]